jgi:hypothetical protein
LFILTQGLTVVKKGESMKVDDMKRIIEDFLSKTKDAWKIG